MNAHFAEVAAGIQKEYDYPVDIEFTVNPDGTVKIPAAWLIEQCGLKGYSEGNAAVYHKQPLVIVNATGEATPDEILSLEQKVIDSVWNRFSIRLSPEVEHI